MSLDQNASKPLTNKTVVLGITGSIAAYKSADLVSELRKLGAEVFVVMSLASQKFIGPLTLQTLSRNPVVVDMWDEENGWQPGHIELADKADLLLVAPATANVIGEFAHGLAPHPLAAIYLATRADVLIAPAMNGKMYTHPIVQQNVSILRDNGVLFVEPEVGELACGYEGIGRLAKVDKIVSEALSVLID